MIARLLDRQRCLSARIEELAAHAEHNQRVRLAVLLHDAPEYVIGDMISPFKKVLGGNYKAVEARLEAAMDAGVVSKAGGADLLDAYDLIADTRLEHQVAQVKSGEKPGNYLDPSQLSDFERSHLRDAFVVVKTMQSALGQGKQMLG